MVRRPPKAQAAAFGVHCVPVFERKPLLAAALLAAAAGCNDKVPCTTCPPVAGIHWLTWTQPLLGTCDFVGPTPDRLNITQSASTVSASVGGAMLSGTLFSTGELTMSGGPPDVHYGLSASATSGSDPDGGITHLQGSLTTTSADGGCESRSDFVGDRVL
jgi:hypothetical protein